MLGVTYNGFPIGLVVAGGILVCLAIAGAL
jgi:hypothetical protein